MRIIKPTVTIDGEDYACAAITLDAEPEDLRTFCRRDYSVSIEMELDYDDVEGTWTRLKAIGDTTVTVVVGPSQLSGTPTMTFTATIPAIPFMSGASIRERMTMTLELVTDTAPVFATIV